MTKTQYFRDYAQFMQTIARKSDETTALASRKVTARAGSFAMRARAAKAALGASA